MTFSKKAINYLYQSSASIGKLFNLQEQQDFLLHFVTKKEIEKFLCATQTNSDHVEKMISFIQYENHNSLYEALINKLIKIHGENEQFLNVLLQTCERHGENNKVSIEIGLKKYEMDNNFLLNSMQEILSDMKIMFEECQSLKISENDERGMKRSHKITSELLSKEVTKLNEEIVHLNSELSQSHKEMEQLQLQISGLANLEDINGIEQSTNVEEKLERLNTNDSDDEADVAMNRKETIHSNDNESSQSPHEKNEQLVSRLEDKNIEQSSIPREKSPSLNTGDCDEAVALLIKKGIGLNVKKDFRKALNCFRECFEMCQRLHKRADHEDIASVLNWMGVCHYNENKYSVALNYFTLAYEMRHRLHSSANDDYIAEADYFAWIGDVFMKQNHFNDAKQYYFKALQVREQLHDGDHDENARILNSIGVLYDNQNQHKEALDYYNQALQVYQRLHDGVHHEIALVFNNIGVILDKQNKLKEALFHYTQAHQIWIRLHHGDHIDITLSLNNIACIHQKNGEWKKSLDYFTSCLEMLRRLNCDSNSLRDVAAKVDSIKTFAPVLNDNSSCKVM